MASTTTAKKEIVDFLWEWTATQGDWSKLLISKIVSTENELSLVDRQSVFDYFLDMLRKIKTLPPLPIVKPIYTPTGKQIELETLSEVTGVNRLAKNQIITFNKNLTVVFGENGTGKTGYGRILKSLGFSYDTNNKVLSNIYTSTQPKAAKIKFKANGVDNTFDWDGTNTNSDLENISVFNSNCVQISLSDRQLIVSPIGFHLFNLVTFELNELNKLLAAKVAQHPTIISWADTLNIGTPQQVFIAGLSSTSTEQRLTELSTFTPAQEQELKGKELELSILNKALLQTEIQNLNSSLIELGNLIVKIQTAQTILTSTNWKALINLNSQITDLESKTRTGIKEIAETNGIEFYTTTEFQTFIKAAEIYIKIIGKPDYPSEDDNCVYCLQPLQTSAKDLLVSYRTLLNDKSQENLLQLKQQKTNLINQVSQIETNLIFHQQTYGLDTEQKIIQPNEINEYNINLRVLKTNFIIDKVLQGSTFNFDYPKYIKFLTDKKTEVDNTLTQKKASLLNIATKETEIKAVIAELKDRKFISTKIAEIKTAITNHKTVNLLNSKTSSFNTYSISRKTSDAREQLVQLNFNMLFNDELKAFRKGHIKIDLNFGTDRGNSKISHKINAHTLTDILSEGEQKAIALSEFLTELQLDNIKAPVIFDDPVNSLDHNIIDDVARRLLKLSNERQVVVFTHSVLLFNSFLYFSKQPTFKGLQCKFYNSKNEFDETGVITEAEEEINMVTSYISKINVLINNTPKGRKEIEIAEDGYGYLRSAIELCIEYDVFKGTVKRYQKNIALTSFIKVDGTVVNIHKDKLNEIFERCCGYIKGHSNPTEIHNDPTMAGLKSDFVEFKTIRAAFT